MKFTAAEVFFVITGYEVPQNILPKEIKEKSYSYILMYLAGETLFTHQLERVRHECKIWLIKNFPFLLLWDLGSETWKKEGAIEYFFVDYANKEHPFFEVEPMPSNFHLSIGIVNEVEILETKGCFKDKIFNKLNE